MRLNQVTRTSSHYNSIIMAGLPEQMVPSGNNPSFQSSHPPSAGSPTDDDDDGALLRLLLLPSIIIVIIVYHHHHHHHHEIMIIMIIYMHGPSRVIVPSSNDPSFQFFSHPPSAGSPTDIDDGDTLLRLPLLLFSTIIMIIIIILLSWVTMGLPSFLRQHSLLGYNE